MEFSNVMDDEELYLDYFNNFLTIDRFAEAWGISKRVAEEIIKRGREIHNGNRI